MATDTFTVVVGWTDNSSNETGFKVYYYDSDGYVLLANTGANATSATVTYSEMATSLPRIFVVSAVNASGETFGDTYVFSLPRSSPVGPIAAPTYVGTSNVTGTSATINWVDNATNESGYLVYRVLGSTQTLVPGCPAGTANLTTCTDTGLVAGTYYQYHVYAWNGGGTGYPGTGVIVHTPKPLPAPIITDASGTSPNSITLHWLDNATDETSHYVYEYVGGGYVFAGFAAANATSFVVASLTPSTQHLYVVLVNRGSESTYSPYGIWATTTAV